MRGQAATIDVIFSTVALLLLVFGLVSFLSAETGNAQAGQSSNERDRLALSTLTELVQTPGEPENWSASDCARPGLSCGEGKICPDKLENLSSLYFSDYDRARRLLNLQAYQVSIFICDPSNHSSCSYALSAQAREESRLASSQVSREEMLSTLDGKTVSVIIFAWE